MPWHYQPPDGNRKQKSSSRHVIYVEPFQNIILNLFRVRVCGRARVCTDAHTIIPCVENVGVRKQFVKVGSLLPRVSEEMDSVIRLDTGSDAGSKFSERSGLEATWSC